MVIDPFSMILLPMMINVVTGPIDARVLLKRFKNQGKPINHDLQKAIKIAYLKALIEIATECKEGKIKSFRLYLPTEIDRWIKQWQSELKQVENAKDESAIAPPFQDTAEIEQLLLSHGQPISDRLQELETRLISQALQGIADIPADYQNQVQTNLFSRIYAHFVEQLKTNDRAYRAFELEYLPAINASLTEIGVGQEKVALTMTDMLSVVNRTDQNVQKIIDILNPKSLTVEDWQEICQQNLALQKQLTTNPFTNTYGVTPQLDEIYVPLAIVERQPPKPPSRNQPEEKEEEKLIPIAEERFFEDVLRQGKSQISQGRKIAIIGEPGSGKTTRLQKIADWILEQDLGLPIWISLADLTQPTITQYIEEIWLKQTGKSLTIDELTQQKERIWLLLDGLDEMTSKVEMRHVSALLGGWVQGLRVVVTCRVNVWEADKNAFSGFDVFRNLEFNPEQVRDYIRRWFAGMGDAATGESLEAALAQSENSRLKELIQNPLRLWMLCQIWQTGGGLPETQAGLYAQFVDWVYRWKADDEILDQREVIDTALARLALAAMEQKDEVSRLRLPESWVVKVLGSRPIFQAVMKLGWLNRVERFPEAICVFYHATFQEYFAALAVDDWDYFLPRNHVNFPVARKEYRIFEPQWKQVILLWLGRGDVADEEKEGFIRALVEFEDRCGEWNFEKVDRGFYEYRAYFLAAAGINEFNCHPFVNKIVNQLVRISFGYFNQEKQEWRTFIKPIEEWARKAIPETIRPLAITELTAILKHCSDEDTRRLVAESLGKIEKYNLVAINALVELIRTAKDKFVRNQAAENLGKMNKGNQEAIDSLIYLLKATEDEDTRREVAVNLCKITPQGNQQVITALIHLLESTNDVNTIRETSWTLKKIGQNNPVAISGLIHIIAITDNQRLCWDAASLLSDIGQKDSKAVASLVKILEKIENRDCYETIIFWLGDIGYGNSEAIASLVNILDNTDNEFIQIKAAMSLSKIDPDNPKAIASLIKLIESANRETILRYAAISLVSNPTVQKNSQVVATLVHILETSENDVNCLWTAYSLSQIYPESNQAINALIRILKNRNNEDTCFQAAKLILNRIDPENSEAISFICDAFNTNPHLFWFSSNCFMKGNSKIITSVIQFLETTQDSFFYNQALDVLGRIAKGNSQAIDFLIRKLGNIDNEVHLYKEAEILGQIALQGNKDAITALVRLLMATKNEYTCMFAAFSLEKIARGYPEAISALLRLCKTTGNHETRHQAVSSLKKMLTTSQQYAKVVSGLKDCLSDEVYQNDFDRFKKCYEVIWNCAENLPYPDFYRAWQGLTETQTSPLVQTLNLAQLPQLLQTQLTETNLHQTLQLLCIDGSKFDNRDNPATDIYLQLVKKHHCPKSTEGTPRTLTELKIYWELLDWEKHPILIFYEEAKPQGVGTQHCCVPTFLDALTRFDATICVITDSPHPTIPTFSPQDPHLIQTIMSWLQRTILEA